MWTRRRFLVALACVLVLGLGAYLVGPPDEWERTKIVLKNEGDRDVTDLSVRYAAGADLSPPWSPVPKTVRPPFKIISGEQMESLKRQRRWTSPRLGPGESVTLDLPARHCDLLLIENRGHDGKLATSFSEDLAEYRQSFGLRANQAEYRFGATGQINGATQGHRVSQLEQIGNYARMIRAKLNL